MKTSFDYDTEEFTFVFLMPLNGKTFRVEACANLQEIMTDEAIFRPPLPEYIDVYMAKLTDAVTGELTESNVYKNQELLKVISETLTKRLITNASKTWFVTDAPRIFLDQWEEATWEMAQKYR